MGLTSVLPQNHHYLSLVIHTSSRAPSFLAVFVSCLSFSFLVVLAVHRHVPHKSIVVFLLFSIKILAAFPAFCRPIADVVFFRTWHEPVGT